MTFWLDAQLSPLLAAWLRWQFQLQVFPLNEIGLRDAEDEEIFQAAKAANVVVITKDADFPQLLERLGPPPQVVWLTCGNTSNEKLRQLLLPLMPQVLELLKSGGPLVEIRGAG